MTKTIYNTHLVMNIFGTATKIQIPCHTQKMKMLHISECPVSFAYRVCVSLWRRCFLSKYQEYQMFFPLHTFYTYQCYGIFSCFYPDFSKYCLIYYLNFWSRQNVMGFSDGKSERRAKFFWDVKLIFPRETSQLIFVLGLVYTQTRN